jgi:hypothetical protein
MEICGLHLRLIANGAAKKEIWRKARKLEICTGSRIARAVAVESPYAAGSHGKRTSCGTIGLVGVACGGLWVKVHAHELKLEAVEMGNVWDEVHEVR